MSRRSHVVLATLCLVGILVLPQAAWATLAKGDVDGNGIVDIEDARLVARFVVGQIPGLPHPENADVTQDGKITIEDALAIAQRVTGSSRFVVVAEEYGLLHEINVGSLVRIQVFESFLPFGITGGTARVTSASTRYDSGPIPLVFERDGRSLYCHWDSAGAPRASDYRVQVDLIESAAAPAAMAQAQGTRAAATPLTSVFTLSQRVFEIPHLARAQDAYCPTPGIPFQFRRVVPQDSTRAPYLGPLGRGWMHNFDVHLEEFTDGRVMFLGPDGFNRYFTSNADGTYNSSPGDHGVLTRNPDGSFQLKEKNGLIYHFRPDLRLDYLEDPNGNRISAIYNTANQLVAIRHSCGESFYLQYNSYGRISRLTDEVGRVTTYEYDLNGTHLAKVTAPGGRVTTYAYSLGQSVASDHRLTQIQFPDGTSVHYAYGDQGRLSSLSGTGGAGCVTFAYGSAGTTQLTDATGGVTTIAVNEQGQPVQIVNPLGAAVQFQYDADLNLSRVTDPLGRVSTIAYDSRGNATQVTDPLSHVSTFAYTTDLNKLAQLTDANGNITSFTYDQRGNCTVITYPDGSTDKFDWDTQGNLRSKTDRAGNMITCTHDARGLLLSKQYPDASTATYTYDDSGNMTSATNASGTITYEYDALDRPVRVTYPADRAFLYEYDAGGKRTKMTDPDGRVLTYEYDAAGRLAAIRDGSGALIVSYVYDAANRRTRKTLGNAAYTTYEYDAAGQVLHLINYGPTGAVISRFDYTYDLVGNRTAKQTIEGNEQYTYDDVGELVGVTYPDASTEGFTYDPLGNRLQATQNGQSTSYVANDLNQYLTVGSAAYQYDLNGNLIRKTEGGVTTTYEYDYENRLVRVVMPAQTVQYAYDAIGLRCARTDAAGTIRYLRDNKQDVIDEDAAHITLAHYTWGGTLDEVVRMSRGGYDYYYAQDTMLSIYNLLDASGQSVEQYRYTAFGQPVTDSAVGNRWFFTGSAYDPATGMQHNRFRDYSPALGRFLTTDPVGIAGGANLYSYVQNRPTVRSDPYGLYVRSASENASSAWGRFWRAFGAFANGLMSMGTKGLSRMVHLNWMNPNLSEAGDLIIGLVPGGGFIEEVSGINDLLKEIEDAAKPPGNNGGSDNGGGNSGSCPTFVQLPLGANPGAAHSADLDAGKEPLAAKISVPINDCLLRSDIPIFGVAGGTKFKQYRVEYGEGRQPTEWHLIASSATPQPTCKVGLAEMAAMQGTLNIQGNLATWNTGLKNWEHLPWHPADDSTDLNGVYTIHLVAEGTDGKQVEDRVTCEVGRAIAQCLPGIAVSPDQRVTMRFPEQSLTHPFRVYTILPLSQAGEPEPAPPAGCTILGSVYRIREPGDRFAKDVSLEFKPEEGNLKARDAAHIGICRYDPQRKEWVWLPSTRSKDGAVFSTALTELPTPAAIYALVFDPGSAARSHPAAASTTPEPLKPVAPGVLVRDTFEQGLGHWKPRDRFVGATLSRDNEITADGSYCLKVTSESAGGNFSCTALDQPFDAREYPLMSFAYRVPPGVKTDFYLLVAGRWYNLQFTGDPMDARNAEVNISNLGSIPAVRPDNQWHEASVNLYQLLRHKTRHTRVDQIIMADWELPAYMKLGFGHNARGATYYIKNFALAAGPIYQVPDSIAVDSFAPNETKNALGGRTGTFSNPGMNLCEASLVPAGDKRGPGSQGALQLGFDTSRDGTYCGYWSALMALNAEEMRALSLRVRAQSDVPRMLVGLRHCTQAEAKVLLGPYLGAPDAQGWRTAVVPLSAFRGIPDLALLDAFFVTFEHDLPSGKGEVLIDEVRFLKDALFRQVTDLSRQAEFNLLGGPTRTIQTGAAAISASYHQDATGAPTGPVGCYRISFGGTIGRDYGEQGFSYAVWEAGLQGMDASGFKTLVIRIRGEQGGERPNLYLDDGTTRACVRAKELGPITKDWREVRIPLARFADRIPCGIDLTHLEAVQLGFEWENMTGTIYVADVHFE